MIKGFIVTCIAFVIIVNMGCSKPLKDLVLSNSHSSNILFFGIDNEITVQGLKSPEQHYFSDSIGNIMLYEGEECHCFNIKAGFEGNRLSLIKKGKEKPVGVFKFDIREVPPPKLSILNKIQGLDVIKLDELKEISQIDTEGYFDIQGYRIVEFTMVTVREGGIIFHKSYNNELTGEMKNELEQLRKGSQVSFESILVEWPNGEKKHAIAFRLEVI